jgi:hypothetical protein
MSALSARSELRARLDKLGDDEIIAVLGIVRVIQSDIEFVSQEYDEANDPTIGLISGPVDLAEKSEEILRAEIDPISGWTQKNKR